MVTLSDPALPPKLALRRLVMDRSLSCKGLHGDLADRLLNVELDRITEDERAADQKITEQWRVSHRAALAGLLDLTSAVLAVLPPALHRAGWPDRRAGH